VVAETLLISSVAAAIFRSRGQRDEVGHYFLKTPPFILEKQQILLQGSLSAWMDGDARKFG
jgi:hypothetical protein